MNMKLSSQLFIPSDGEIYCHIFENSLVGLNRNLFWSVTINFEPIQIGNEECNCSLICDWLRWPIRSWEELDNCNLEFQYGAHGFESSLYLYAHHPSKHTTLSLKLHKDNNFITSIAADVLIDDNIGFDIDRPLSLNATATIPFSGLLIDPENLGLRSGDVNKVMQIAGEFVDLASFHPPEKHGDGFRFLPKF